MGFLFNSKKLKNANEVKIGNGKVISFINQKGGVGKTTMTFNVAHALAQAGKKVLAIDMDPQANLSLLFNVDLAQRESSYNIYNLLINSVRELKSLHTPVLLDEVLMERQGVDLIPSAQELSGLELSVASISSPRQVILRRFLERSGLLDRYDYILVDGPPTLGLIVVNIICASHGVMVPFRPDEFSKKGLGHFYEVMEQVEEMGITQIPEVILHIPNLVDLRRKQETQDLESITKKVFEAFGEGKMSDPFINRAQLVKSQAQKKSVFDFKSKEFAPLQKQFNNMAQAIEEWESAR